MPAPEDQRGEKQAILRSDAPVPVLSIMDVSAEGRDPGFKEYADTVTLSVTIEGQLGTIRDSLKLELEELAELAAELHQVVELNRTCLSWTSYCKRISIRLNVEMDKFGPPVHCTISLGQMRAGYGHSSPEEYYECNFDTNLGWINEFTVGLVTILMQYQRARELLA